MGRKGQMGDGGIIEYAEMGDSWQIDGEDRDIQRNIELCKSFG